MAESKQAQGAPWSMIKRRVFGRGTIFLIISLLVIGGWSLMHPPKVTIERRVETSGEVTIKRKPALSDLLSWSKELNLSAAQEESIKELLKTEQVELQPVEDEIAKVVQAFNELASKHKDRSASPTDYEASARPISHLSREKRQIEQSFAERGLGVLDATQKDKAARLWQDKLARMTGGKKEVANP